MLSTHQEPITVFLHGITANQTQSAKYIDKTIITPCIAPNFPDTQPVDGTSLNSLVWRISNWLGKPVNREKSYLGQTQDIESISSEIPQENPFILYGVSRGGTAALRYIAQYNPKNLKALIIESAPHDVSHKSLEILQSLRINLDHKQLMHTLFPAYNPQEPTILECIQNIKNKDLPIMIVHSQTDARVSFQQSVELYYALRLAGFSHIFLVPLPQGNHTFIIDSKSDESITYLTAVHSFYKLYTLPYQHEYAVLTKQQLQILYQPGAATINSFLAQELAKLEQAKQRIYYAYALTTSLFVCTSIYFAYYYYYSLPS
jgi:pimeloyl-ACP methyl ester carboxylesterase